mmetsp:Transcript_21776/g.32548  ORF Transcript_21776/g.32548 Transcript_21776/m.32548 type:complete len:222 (-) Transcript_21776:299-964(-)
MMQSITTATLFVLLGTTNAAFVSHQQQTSPRLVSKNKYDVLERPTTSNLPITRRTTTTTTTTSLNEAVYWGTLLYQHQFLFTGIFMGITGLFGSYVKRERLAEQAYYDRLLDVQKDRGLPVADVNDLMYLESIIAPDEIYDPYLDDPYAKEDFDPDEEVFKDPYYGDRYYRDGDVFFRINGNFYRAGSLATRNNFEAQAFEDNRDDFFAKFEERFRKGTNE